MDKIRIFPERIMEKVDKAKKLLEEFSEFSLENDESFAVDTISADGLADVLMWSGLDLQIWHQVCAVLLELPEFGGDKPHPDDLDVEKMVVHAKRLAMTLTDVAPGTPDYTVVFLFRAIYGTIAGQYPDKDPKADKPNKAGKKAYEKFVEQVFSFDY